MASKNSTTSGNSAGAAPRQARTSIHTPLQPASVQDLKAKFDQSNKSAGDSGKSSSGGTTSPRHQAAASGGLSKSSLSSSSLASSSSASSKLASSGVSLSGLSSSLQAAAHRKIGLGTVQSSTSSSSSVTTPSFSSSASSSSSSGLSASAKSSIALTTARPFQPSSSSSSSKSSAVSATNSGRSSPILNKTVTKSNTQTSSSLSSSSSSSLSSTSSSIAAKWEPKSAGSKGLKNEAVTKNFVKDKDGRLELPVTHVTSSSKVESRVHNNKWNGSGSGSGLGADVKKDITGSRYLGKKVSETKEAFDKPADVSSKVAARIESNSKPSSPSPPVQRTKKIIAREIKIERLDSGAQITTYKDGGGIAGASTNSVAGKSSSTDAAHTGKKDSAAAVKVGPGKKILEIKVQQGSSSGRSSPSSPASTTSSTGSRGEQERVPEFRQVKLRKAAAPAENKKSTSDSKVPTSGTVGGGLAVKQSDDANKRLSRKISAERFERIMFDFQRGVPTEMDEDLTRRGSETDHILLQEKVRAMTSRASGGRRRDKEPAAGVKNGNAAAAEDNDDDETDVPIINKKKKEESIFREGLKVSDFVKQVNKLNPGSEAAPPPKWKVQRAQSQASSAASSDVGPGDAMDGYYQGIPGEDMPNFSDEEDDIYEKVTQRGPPSVSTDGEQDTAESAKAPGRRLGVYSQMKNLKNLAFRKLKPKGGKKKAGKSTKTDTLSDSEEIVVHSDGEGGWQHNSGGDNQHADSDDSGDSTGTEYEDVGPDAADFDGEDDAPDGAGDGEECVYEDLEDLGLGRPGNKSSSFGTGRGAGGSSAAGKNKTLTHKLKNIFYNKKAKAAKKSKAVVDSGVSADTDSEGDQLEEGSLGPGDSTPDIPAVDAISRTSSERSSGRFVRDDSGTTTTAATTTTSNTGTAASTYTLASAIDGSSIKSAASTNNTSTTAAPPSLGGDSRSKSSPSLSATATSTSLSSSAQQQPTAATTTQASSSSAPSAPSVPPPPPPSSTSSSSTTTTTTTTTSSNAPMSSSNMPPPPLPPRTSKNLSQALTENSPPLPPRNPAAPPKSATLGIPLDTVVPISPPGHRGSTGSKYDKKKDRFSFGPDVSENNITPKLDYIDYDPASAGTLERIDK
ncbi:hypothetical protein EGW08_013581, partial [Elysia chlorotica]